MRNKQNTTYHIRINKNAHLIKLLIKTQKDVGKLKQNYKNKAHKHKIASQNKSKMKIDQYKNKKGLI